MPKINEKFKPLYTSRKRYFLITGGRGSSKSFSVSDFLLRLTYESEQVVLFTRWTLTSAEISIIPEFTEKMDINNAHADFDTSRGIVENKITGSKIIFRGIKTSSGNQTANLKSIKGVTTWVLDEAEELVEEGIFDKIDDSIRHKSVQNRVIIILNPVTDAHWIYKRFFESGLRDDTEYIHTTYLDNIENLNKSFIQKAESIKISNPIKYKHTYLGEWLDKAEGVVFDNWEVGEFEASLPYLFGQDYGFSIDPTTLIRVAIDEGKKIIYCKEEYYLQGLSTGQIDELNKQYAYGCVIVADSAEPRLIDELKKLGNKMIEAHKGQGSVSAGLLAMLDYKLIIEKESVNLQKELRNYIWIDKGSKLVCDEYNHAIDAIRYAFTYMTMFKKRQTW